MSKKPKRVSSMASVADVPRNEELLAADQAPVNPAVKVKHNARGYGALKDRQGLPVKGYHYVDPGSLPGARTAPEPDRPVMPAGRELHLLAIEWDEARGVFRYRLLQAPAETLDAIEAFPLHDSGVVRRGVQQLAFQQAMAALRKLRHRALGIPAMTGVP